jgi:hypothetical protein
MDLYGDMLEDDMVNPYHLSYWVSNEQSTSKK